MSFKDLVPSQKRGEAAQREEYNPLDLLRRQMDEVFDSFLSGFEFQPFEGHSSAFSPKVDIAETDKEIQVTAELPGMDDKSVEVSLTKDSLTIRGEKKEEKKEKGRDYHRKERLFGSFTKVIHLPVNIDEDKVEAAFQKGVLSITLPKTAESASRTMKIAIRATS